MGTKNQRAVYEKVNISDNQVYEWVRFFHRYMNGVGFEILARTPVTKLPPSYPLRCLQRQQAYKSLFNSVPTPPPQQKLASIFFYDQPQCYKFITVL